MRSSSTHSTIGKESIGLGNTCEQVKCCNEVLDHTSSFNWLIRGVGGQVGRGDSWNFAKTLYWCESVARYFFEPSSPINS